MLWIGFNFGDYDTGAYHPDPPDEAETLVVGRINIVVRVTSDRLANDDIELPAAAEIGGSVIYDQDEGLPPTLAREIYPAFHDQLIVLDANGDRCDLADELAASEDDRVLA